MRPFFHCVPRGSGQVRGDLFRSWPAWAKLLISGFILVSGHTEIIPGRVAACGAPGTLQNVRQGNGNWCGIDFHEGDKIDEKALKALVRTVVQATARPVIGSPTMLGRSCREIAPSEDLLTSRGANTISSIMLHDPQLSDELCSLLGDPHSVGEGYAIYCRLFAVLAKDAR